MYENLHAGPHDSFGKIYFEQSGVRRDHSIQTSKKQIAVPSPSVKSISHVTENKIFFRCLEKHFWKSNL